MNILIYFGNQLNPQKGGTERIACKIADYLTEAGYNIYYMCACPSNDSQDRESSFLPDMMETPSDNNVAYIQHFISTHKIDAVINEGASTESVYLFSHEYIPSDVRIINHLHFNVRGDIDNFYRTLYLPVRGVSLKMKVTNICKLLKAPYNKWYSLDNKRKRYRYMHANSDSTVVLSDKQLSAMKRLIGVGESKKVISIPNPIEIVVEPDLSEKTNEILFVGRLDYSSKRVDRVLRVWHRLQNRLPEWSLKIIGSGPDENRLKKIASNMRLNRVAFIGNTDPTPHYSRARILLLTSNYEGTPTVIPEAMSRGVVPIVMNSFSDADMFIRDGGNGYLTPPFNIAAMANTIENLANNPANLNEMSNNGIKTILDFQKKLSRIFHLWEELVEVKDAK